MSSDTTNGSKRRIAYLIGAGGSHACVKAHTDAYGTNTCGILMGDLTTDLAQQIGKKVRLDSKYLPLSHLVNAIAADDQFDIEHLITFYEGSPSASHNDFAEVLRDAFYSVLRRRLNSIKKEIGVR